MMSQATSLTVACLALTSCEVSPRHIPKTCVRELMCYDDFISVAKTVLLYMIRKPQPTNTHNIKQVSTHSMFSYIRKHFLLQLSRHS